MPEGQVLTETERKTILVLHKKNLTQVEIVEALQHSQSLVSTFLKAPKKWEESQ